VLAVLLVRANRGQEVLVEALRRQVTADLLTGPATRRAFDAALDVHLARSAIPGTALVLIDVDAFTTINDRQPRPPGRGRRAGAPRGRAAGERPGR
jgi:GGDEF domain-containing protein